MDRIMTRYIAYHEYSKNVKYSETEANIISYCKLRVYDIFRYMNDEGISLLKTIHEWKLDTKSQSEINRHTEIIVALHQKASRRIYGRLNPVGVPLGQFPGITVAIPSNIVNKAATSIVEKGYYLHPGIGIMGETLASDLLQRLAGFVNITSIPQGVFVSKIQRNGTADLAGIHGSVTNEYGEILSGDVITAIDGIPVTRFEDLLSYVQEHKSVGDNIFFTVYRNGQILELQGVVLTFHPFGPT
jgi:PDZ domain